MAQLWTGTVEGMKGAKDAKEIAKDNALVEKKNAEAQPDGAGADVTDWATDDVYFSRVFKQYSTA